MNLLSMIPTSDFNKAGKKKSVAERAMGKMVNCVNNAFNQAFQRERELSVNMMCEIDNSRKCLTVHAAHEKVLVNVRPHCGLGLQTSSWALNKAQHRKSEYDLFFQGEYELANAVKPLAKLAPRYSYFCST